MTVPESKDPHASPPIAIGLARASSDHQEHSVGDQRAEIDRWCAQTGHRLLRVFDDEGISGSVLDRSGLSALLDYVEASKQKGVVVIWRRNRLARPDDPRDGLLLERRIERAGWKLHFLQGAQQSGNPLVDTLMATIEHHQSGEFLRTLATDIARGITRRVQEGTIVIGYAPYGYAREVTWPNGSIQVVPRTTRLRTDDAKSVRFVPGDPKEIEVVRSIFQEYATNSAGALSLVARLNADKVPGPRDNALWGANTIRSILKNPVYAGDLVWNRRTIGKFVKIVGRQPQLKGRKTRRMDWNPAEEWIVLRDHHEPLVSRAVWGRANEVLKERATEQGSRRRPRAYALSGIVHCANCGTHMAGWSAKTDGRMYSRYACQGARHHGICRNYAVNQVDLERAVLAKLRAKFEPLASAPDFRGRVLRVLQRRIGARVESDADRARLVKEVSQLKARIGTALDNMGEVGVEVAKQLAGKIEAWSARQKEAELELARLRERQSVHTDLEQAADEVVSLVRELMEIGMDRPVEVRRHLLQRAVERVDLHFETYPPKTGKRLRCRFTAGTVTVAKDLASLVDGEPCSMVEACAPAHAGEGANMCAVPNQVTR